MAAPLPPVPPLTKDGFADPVWIRWLQLLRQSVLNGVTTANLIFTPGNGFTGSFSPSGGSVSLSIGVSVPVGLVRSNGTGLASATPGVDFVQGVNVVSPIGNSGTFAAPTITHATSGVTAGTYTKVTVNAFGHVTVGTAIGGGDITGALGYTPLSPANNLSDVSNPATARTNLGLGTIATQNANAVTITGGSISGVSVSATTLGASGNDSMMYLNSSGQAIPNSVSTVITNWTLIYDRLGANFNPTTGVFTAPVTGVYLISAGLLWSPTSQLPGSLFRTMISANGVLVAHGIAVAQTATTTLQHSQCTAVVSLAAGQTLNVTAIQNSGAAAALSTSVNTSYLSIARIP